MWRLHSMAHQFRIMPDRPLSLCRCMKNGVRRRSLHTRTASWRCSRSEPDPPFLCALTRYASDIEGRRVGRSLLMNFSNWFDPQDDAHFPSVVGQSTGQKKRRLGVASHNSAVLAKQQCCVTQLRRACKATRLRKTIDDRTWACLRSHRPPNEEREWYESQKKHVRPHDSQL